MKVLWSPIYYKIEGNYFKGKIWVLYKLKTKTSGKGYSFEIIVLLISVTTLTSGIFTHTTANVSLTLSVATWVCRLPLRFHISEYILMRHHLAGTKSFALVFYLYGPFIFNKKTPYVICTKFETNFIDLIIF